MSIEAPATFSAQKTKNSFLDIEFDVIVQAAFDNARKKTNVLNWSFRK